MIHLYKKKIGSEIFIYSWLSGNECFHNPEIAIPRLISTKSDFSSFKLSSEKNGSYFEKIFEWRLFEYF
jgi:hypothetical protein